MAVMPVYCGYGFSSWDARVFAAVSRPSPVLMMPKNGFGTRASSAAPCESAADGMLLRAMLVHSFSWRVPTYATSPIICPGSWRCRPMFHMCAYGVSRSR